jgi:hypothetical protein
VCALGITTCGRVKDVLSSEPPLRKRNGRLAHAPEDGEDGEDGEGGGEEGEESEEDDGSDYASSEDDGPAPRDYPRSRAQMIVDLAEDDLQARKNSPSYALRFFCSSRRVRPSSVSLFFFFFFFFFFSGSFLLAVSSSSPVRPAVGGSSSWGVCSGDGAGGVNPDATDRASRAVGPRALRLRQPGETDDEKEDGEDGDGGGDKDEKKEDGGSRPGTAGSASDTCCF